MFASGIILIEALYFSNQYSFFSNKIYVLVTILIISSPAIVTLVIIETLQKSENSRNQTKYSEIEIKNLKISIPKENPQAFSNKTINWIKATAILALIGCFRFWILEKSMLINITNSFVFAYIIKVWLVALLILTISSILLILNPRNQIIILLTFFADLIFILYLALLMGSRSHYLRELYADHIYRQIIGVIAINILHIEAGETEKDVIFYKASTILYISTFILFSFVKVLGIFMEESIPFRNIFDLSFVYQTFWNEVFLRDNGILSIFMATSIITILISASVIYDESSSITGKVVIMLVLLILGSLFILSYSLFFKIILVFILFGFIISRNT